MLNKKELARIISALESVVALDISAGRKPSDTVKAFCDGEGHETAACCIAAMVRCASWDGRISRAAKEWATSVELPQDWARRVDEIYFNRIHMAHLSQLAEAMSQFQPDPELPPEIPEDVLRHLEETEDAENWKALTGMRTKPDGTPWILEMFEGHIEIDGKFGRHVTIVRRVEFCKDDTSAVLCADTIFAEFS